MFTKNDNCVKKFSPSDKFKIGYRMMSGMGYHSVKREFNVSRSYAYYLEGFADRSLDFIDAYDPDEKWVPLTKELEKRIIVALGTYCHSSEEGIQRFLQEVFQADVSVSKISVILNESGKRAAEWDQSVPLDNIRTCASDEIFQCGKPVLTSVDPESVYAIQIEGVKP